MTELTHEPTEVELACSRCGRAMEAGFTSLGRIAWWRDEPGIPTWWGGGEVVLPIPWLWHGLRAWRCRPCRLMVLDVGGPAERR